MKELTIKQYQDCIIDICDSLVTDLLYFLKDEGRYKYRMIRCMNKIMDIFKDIYDKKSNEEIEFCERIIYLTNKNIRIDYKRLRARKLSPADSTICLILKLISIAKELQEEINPKILKVEEILQSFYENIRNKGKKDKLKRTENIIKDAIKSKKIGKLRKLDINLYEVEHPEPKKQELIGEKKSWGIENKEKEIEL